MATHLANRPRPAHARSAGAGAGSGEPVSGEPVSGGSVSGASVSSEPAFGDPGDPTSAARLRARAVRWLAQREHSRSELEARLLAWARTTLANSVAGTGAHGRPGRARPGRHQAEAREAPEPADNTADNTAENAPHNAALQAAHHAAQAHAAALAQALPQQVAAVMDQLALQHWQSDARFVESRVNARQARWGTRRIAMELKQHGLGLAPEVQDQLKRSELARAQAIWVRRYGATPTDAAEFGRQSRFLLARGFSHDTVRRVVPRPGQTASDTDEPVDLHDSGP